MKIIAVFILCSFAGSIAAWAGTEILFRLRFRRQIKKLASEDGFSAAQERFNKKIAELRSMEIEHNKLENGK